MAASRVDGLSSSRKDVSLLSLCTHLFGHVSTKLCVNSHGWRMTHLSNIVFDRHLGTPERHLGRQDNRKEGGGS